MKKILTGILLVFLVGWLVSCGETAGGNIPPESPNSGTINPSTPNGGGSVPSETYGNPFAEKIFCGNINGTYWEFYFSSDTLYVDSGVAASYPYEWYYKEGYPFFETNEDVVFGYLDGSNLYFQNFYVLEEY